MSICWSCTGVGKFNADGSIRRLTPDEDQELRQDKQIQDALMVMRKSMGPTAAADILRHKATWEAAQLRTETGEQE